MTLSWSHIMFVPDDETAAAAAGVWAWRVPQPWTIIASSVSGGLFLDTADDACVVAAREWFALTGDMHRQIRDLPDGGQVQIKVVD